MPREKWEKLPVLILPEERGAAGCSYCSDFKPEPLRSGNLQVDPEIHLLSPDIDVDIADYYNAVSTNNGPFGYGRQLSLNLTAQSSCGAENLA